MSYCAMDKTAPNKPNSGFDAFKLNAKSERKILAATFLREESSEAPLN